MTEPSEAVISAAIDVWQEAKRCELEAHSIKVIARAITEAEERGAAREREEAARIGYAVCAKTRHVRLGDEVAAAIRARGGVKPA